MLDFQKAISTQELLKAVRQCAHNVSWKESVTAWLFYAEYRCAILHSKLANGTYKLSEYGRLHLDGPKPRDIFCTKFIDRVVQRSMCNNGLYNELVKHFVPTNGACLNDKGLTYCMDQFSARLRHCYFSNNIRTNDFWYVKLDIKKFFDSTPHIVVKQQFCKYIKDEDFRKHIIDIVDSFKDSRPLEEIQQDPFGERGMYLGSQISQLLQLMVLNEFDHTMVSMLKLPTYIRYMDDIVFITNTKAEAIFMLEYARQLLAKYGFELNEKSRIGKVSDGVQFLKTTFKLTETGKVTKKFSKKGLGKEFSHINTLLQLYNNGNLSTFTLVQHFNSWFGSNRHKMNAGQLRKANEYVINAITTIFDKVNNIEIER